LESITGFSDQLAGWTTSITESRDATYNLANNNDSDLGDFLGRPVKVWETQWVVGQPLFENFNPWELFLVNPRVKEKTSYYELLRMNLHAKFVISGTGFHYGRAIVSYNPYLYDEVTVERNFLDQDIIGASQKPHIFLNPTNNSGGQIDMPFFYHNNYMSLTDNDSSMMGELAVKSFGNLKHANGGDDPVTVTAFVWASDVTLTVPTSLNAISARDYSPQSGKMNAASDEYGKGIISKPASAIAHAAGALTNLPSIAPYARATEMMAKGVGQMASNFGYSRPPVVTDMVLQKPSPTGNLSNTDAADAVNKLSLDSKQELTIDSRTVGLDGQDQMGIVDFACRESYLTNFSMASTQAPNTLLWNCRVGPSLYDSVPGISAELHATPMCYLAQAFKYWQGSIKFRFQAVKSNFHKGRILLRWDPKSHGSTVEYNTVYSRVIDLAEEDDFEVVIGWGQSQPWLQTEVMLPVRTDTIHNTSRLPTSFDNKWNGILEVDVVNSLVAPAPDTDISFNVYVSCVPDIKFASPNPSTLHLYSLFPELGDPLTTIPEDREESAALPSLKDKPLSEYKRRSTGYTGYSPQSGTIEEAPSGTTMGATDIPVDPGGIQDIAVTSKETDQTMNVYFGESPKSLRDLMRRYVHHRTWVFRAPTAGTITQTNLRDKAIGYWPGFDPKGIDVNSGFPATVTIPHYLHWFSPCYAAWRGGLRNKYVFDDNQYVMPTVSRVGFDNNSPVETFTLSDTSADYLTQRLTATSNQYSAGGSASTNLGVNNTIEVETPFYHPVRFASARLPKADTANGSETNIVSMISGGTDFGLQDAKKYSCSTWKSVGEDFSLFFFTGCPIVYLSGLTVPVQ
jgi:hypothetical protein